MILFSRLFTFYDGMKMRDILELNESFGARIKHFFKANLNLTLERV